jgi:hypothetical protein
LRWGVGRQCYVFIRNLVGYALVALGGVIVGKKIVHIYVTLRNIIRDHEGIKLLKKGRHHNHDIWRVEKVITRG